jgi:predicted GNAT family N-acyltransferase
MHSNFTYDTMMIRKRGKAMKIIKATNNDELERCLNIRNEVFTIEKGISKEIEVDENDNLNSGYDFFIAAYNDKDAGALRCIKASNDTVKIQRFCVLKQYRKQGIGKRILEEIENYYKANKITKLELDAKFSVCGFYEKCGFEKVSDIFIEAGVEHVKMVKLL